MPINVYLGDKLGVMSSYIGIGYVQLYILIQCYRIHL